MPAVLLKSAGASPLHIPRFSQALMAALHVMESFSILSLAMPFSQALTAALHVMVSLSILSLAMLLRSAEGSLHIPPFSQRLFPPFSQRLFPLFSPRRFGVESAEQSLHTFSSHSASMAPVARSPAHRSAAIYTKLQAFYSRMTPNAHSVINNTVLSRRKVAEFA